MSDLFLIICFENAKPGKEPGLCWLPTQSIFHIRLKVAGHRKLQKSLVRRTDPAVIKGPDIVTKAIARKMPIRAKIRTTNTQQNLSSKLLGGAAVSVNRKSGGASLAEDLGD